MKCNHCGALLRNESNYCFGCGESVNAKDCYIAELKESGKVLTRQTDKDSLNRIVELTEKIFNRTRENPDLKYEARRFVESYLPMVTDVVSRYKEVKRHKAVKNQMDDIKDNLTEVLDRTEEAFEIMIAELYENDIMELQVNIETLRRKIYMDGLVKSSFDIEE